MALLADHRSELTGAVEDIAHALVAVSSLAESSYRGLYSGEQVRNRGLDRQVKVIAQQRPGAHPADVAAADLSDAAEEGEAVPILFEDRFAAVATGHYRWQGARRAIPGVNYLNSPANSPVSGLTTIFVPRSMSAGISSTKPFVRVASL